MRSPGGYDFSALPHLGLKECILELEEQECTGLSDFGERIRRLELRLGDELFPSRKRDSVSSRPL